MQFDKLDKYKQQAAKTAVYPEPAAIRYLCLGLVGEAGEVCNEVKKMIRNDHGDIANRKANVLDELGDVLWYTAMLMSEMGIQYSDLETLNDQKLDGHDNALSRVEMLADDALLLSDVSSWFVTSCLSSTSNGSRPSPSTFTYAVLLRQLIDAIAQQLDSNILEVATANLEKLAQRKANKSLKERSS